MWIYNVVLCNTQKAVTKEQVQKSTCPMKTHLYRSSRVTYCKQQMDGQAKCDLTGINYEHLLAKLTVVDGVVMRRD